MTITIPFRKLHPEAQLPTRGSSAAVGLDLHALLLTESGRPNTALIPPNSTKNIPTGLSVVVPPALRGVGCYAQVVSRSGLAGKSIFVANAPGIIDPDYTGEICVLLYNGGHESYYVKHGDRIAQLIMTSTTFGNAAWIETAPITTERGAKGLGSTGR